MAHQRIYTAVKTVNYLKRMTSGQRKLVMVWSGVLFLIVLATIYVGWVLDNWHWLRWPVYAVILLLVIRGGKEVKGSVQSGKEVLDSYPLLRGWILCYVICIVLFLIYGIATGIEFHKSPGKWLLLGFVPLFAPWIVAGEYRRYKRFGQQRNDGPKQDTSR